jgi:hypothetical protein
VSPSELHIGETQCFSVFCKNFGPVSLIFGCPAADKTGAGVISGLPFEYMIDKERKLIVTTAEGSVTAAEVRNKIDRLLSDPDFHRDLNELIDATGVTKLYVPVMQALEFAGRPILSAGSRTAWVVSTSSVWRTLADMLAAYMSLHTQCQVFSDIPSAMAWISQPAQS